MFSDVLDNVKYLVFAGNGVRVFAYCVYIRELASFWWRNKYGYLLCKGKKNTKMTLEYLKKGGNLVDKKLIPSFIDVGNLDFKNHIVSLFVKEKIKGFGATSSGSIISFFLSLGVIPFKTISKECRRSSNYFLKSNLMTIDPNRLFNKGGIFDHGILKTSIENTMIKYGIDPSITFKQHYEMTKIEITFNAVTFETQESLLMNYQTVPNLKVVDAIMATTALPLLYPPININGKYYVDGGISINYLLQLYPENECIGVTMGNQKDPEILQYFKRVCGLESFCPQNITGGIQPSESSNVFIGLENSSTGNNFDLIKNMSKIFTGFLSFSLDHVAKLNLEKLNANQLNRTIYIRTPYILSGEELIPSLRKNTKKAFREWAMRQLILDFICIFSSIHIVKRYGCQKTQNKRNDKY